MKTRDVLRDHFESLQAEIKRIEGEAEPLRAARDRLMAEIQPLEDQARELAQQIKALEQPHLAELKMELSNVAKAMGGKRMSEGPA